MSLREEARIASVDEATAAMRAEGVPEHVIEAGGPEHYAAGQAQLLHDAITNANWDLVRAIAEDPYTAGGDVDAARGALAGAMQPAGNGRHGVPDTHVYSPEKGDYLAPGANPGNLPVQREPEPEVVIPPEGRQVGRLKLSARQMQILLAGMHENRVKTRQGQSHLEAWDVRRTLIRAFGFGGYSDRTLELSKIYEHIAQPGEIQYRNGGHNDRPVFTVVYLAQVRLTIYNADGSVGAEFDDAATGDGANMPSYQAAADFAVKTALSQALKRCAVNLGDQFGLSLYNGGSTAPVVQLTLVGPQLPVSDPALVEKATHSDVVRSEEETPNYLADPGLHADADPGTGLPTASALAEEAKDPGTSPERLMAILSMVHSERGSHPHYGPMKVTNENGSEETLHRLVWRKHQESKGRKV